MTRLFQVLVLVVIVLPIVATPASVAGAQDAEAIDDPHPLRPADTSSPRATLRSFLTHADEALREWKPDQLSRAAYRAFHRAVETLDFSSTPDHDAWRVRSRRLMLLKEILDRIELPPDDEIPGDREVADGAITRWTIPDTTIAIERIERGPRAGQFLFSAGTVRELDRLYRHAKHLPYKPGAIGFYEDIIRSETTVAALGKQVANRLKPVDTSNPRSTLEGFLDSVTRAYLLVVEAGSALDATPPNMTIEAAREVEIKANNLLERATSTLDLSAVPAALRKDTGIESVLQLKEIFDRTLLPPLDTIPHAEMVKIARQEASGSSLRTAGPLKWRYPNTEIEIVEVVEGDRQGQFLFSAATVSRISDFYEEIRDLPYRKDDYGPAALDYPSPGKSEGFYTEYILGPGYLIPQVHFLSRLLERLPPWFMTVYGGQTAWQWIGLVLCLLSVVLAAFVVFGVIRRLARRRRPPLDEWLMILAPVASALMVIVIGDFIDNDLNVTGPVLSAVLVGSRAIAVALTSWATFRLCKATAETIIALPQIGERTIDASLLRLGAAFIGFLLGAWILISGVGGLGVDILPLLAGLGVGGLAIALAARPTMENIIGSFMIFWDRPYAVGDRVNVMGHNGTVESISLRSTKIRLLNGHLTSIPNEKMASVEIENIGRRRSIRRNINITITYDTPPEKVNRTVEIVREILAVPEAPDSEATDSTRESAGIVIRGAGADRRRHPNEAINRPGFPPRVFFNEFNPDSLNILVSYWFHPPGWWDYLEHAHWINLQIVERLNAEGIDFAFPTQTLHLAGDEKRPLTVGQRLISPD